MKIPKTLGACVDTLYTLRAERLQLQREMDAKIEALKADELKLKDHILKTFDKSDIEGAKGTRATAAVTRTTVPSVTDWPKVYDYIRDHDAFDLLERRMSKTAFRDRLEQNIVIPGVEAFVVTDLSLTKIPEK